MSQNRLNVQGKFSVIFGNPWGRNWEAICGCLNAAIVGTQCCRIEGIAIPKVCGIGTGVAK